MDSTELIKTLHEATASLDPENISHLDFEQLQQLLDNTATHIETLQVRATNGDKLLSLFREELINRARAIAKAQGAETHLALQILSQPNLSLTELLKLRQQLDAEFDQVFSVKLTEPSEAAAKSEEVNQFKI
ncbi:MAG: hypothetical protein ABIJ61_02420 [bacterium]